VDSGDSVMKMGKKLPLNKYHYEDKRLKRNRYISPPLTWQPFAEFFKRFPIMELKDGKKDRG
jgi:hypothetical protein